jgi:outer membrane protein TolC
MTFQTWRTVFRQFLFMAACLPSLGGSLAWAADGESTSLVEPLSREVLIAQVLESNPTVESARQAWREALARIPQVTALADPMVAYEAAPGSLGFEADVGQVVRLSQRFEWPGKQGLRGAMAQAEAEARDSDLDQVRMDLALTASMLFDDHYVVQRSLEINREHLGLLTGLQESAVAQYAAGRGRQQDPLQAEVELALLERERLALVSRQQVIVAQLNGLLHRAPGAALPPAPARLLGATMPAGDAASWAERATRDRPELSAITHRMEARRSAVALARRASLPDFALMGTYNSMMPMPEHRFMFGVSLNIPLQIGAKRGGVDQAKAALARTQSLHLSQVDGVRVELTQAWVRLEEAIAEASLYEERILPAARSQVAAAEAGYQSGRDDFSDLMAAERRLRSLERQYEESLAKTWTRRALLARAAGVAPNTLSEGGAK